MSSTNAVVVNPSSRAPGVSDAQDLSLASLSSNQKSALHSGLLMHGEHAVDLLLVQGACEGTHLFDGFVAAVRHLCSGIRCGHLVINEKIDGSPAVVLGFDFKGNPFVAYKGGLSRKTKQQIFTCEADVLNAFKAEDGRRKLYLALVKHVLPKMAQLKEQGLEQYMFQADLLFVEGDDRRKLSEKGISIKPNTVCYNIAPQHPLFTAASEASVGLAVHTICKRELDSSNKRIEASASSNLTALDKFVSGINGAAVMALDPFSWVDVHSAGRAEEIISKVEVSLEKIQNLLWTLTPEFRAAWRAQHLAAFRVFNNASLLPGADGGLFACAANKKRFYALSCMRRYKDKLRHDFRKLEKTDPKKKESGRLLRSCAALMREQRSSFESLLNAYFEAIAIQQQIDSVLKSGLRSKIGGGPVEGIMISADDLIVKWIDRLDFTRKNNQRWRGDGASWRDVAVLPAPFDSWKPGAIILPMKLQPPHVGHIEMIREVKKAHPQQEVIVLASEKEAKLDAQSWSGLGLAPIKRDLRDGNYRHPFSKEIRSRLLKHALGDEVTVCMLPTSILNEYLSRAKEAGQKEPIFIALGAKEKEETRYQAQLKEFAGLLEPVYMPMQSHGINGTMVRVAVREAALSDSKEAMAKLEQALSYVTDASERVQCRDALVAEYKKAHQRVREVLAL